MTHGRNTDEPSCAVMFTMLLFLAVAPNTGAATSSNSGVKIVVVVVDEWFWADVVDAGAGEGDVVTI